MIFLPGAETQKEVLQGEDTSAPLPFVFVAVVEHISHHQGAPVVQSCFVAAALLDTEEVQPCFDSKKEVGGRQSLAGH